MKNYRIFSSLVVIFLASMISGGCGDNNFPDDDAETVNTTPVEVVQVERDTIERYIDVRGTVASDGHVNVVSQLGGKVEEIKVSVGHQVDKGQILLQLNNDELASQLRRAEAEVEQAEHNFYINKNIALPQKMEQAENRAREAEIEYNNVRKNLERIERLFDADAVSQEELEQVESRYQLTKMAYETAKTNLAREQTSQDRELAMLSSQLKSAREALTSTRINYEKSYLEAPIRGTVTSVNARVGQELSPGSPIVTLVDYSGTYVEIKLTERLLEEIQEDTEAIVSLPASGQFYSGIVREIDLTPMEGTRSYRAKAYFEADNQVRIGQQATLQVLAEKAEDVITIPAAALLKDNDTSTVFVIEDKTAVKRKVTTGMTTDNYAEITDGLQEDEKLVIKGQHYLEDGLPVEIVGGEKR